MAAAAVALTKMVVPSAAAAVLAICRFPLQLQQLLQQQFLPLMQLLLAAATAALITFAPAISATVPAVVAAAAGCSKQQL